MQVGIILSNQLLGESTKRKHGQVLALLEIVRSLHSNMGINSLMFTITEKSPGLVDADRCTLYLVCEWYTLFFWRAKKVHENRWPLHISEWTYKHRLTKSAKNCGRCRAPLRCASQWQQVWPELPPHLALFWTSKFVSLSFSKSSSLLVPRWHWRAAKKMIGCLGGCSLQQGLR